MNNMFNNNNLIDLVKPFSDIIIVSHKKPDGDAIASCLSLAMYLKKNNIKAKVLLESYHEKYDVIPGKEFLFLGEVENLNPDVFISLDCGSKDRFGSNSSFLFEKAKITINIDHHISNDNYADYNYVDPKASSTSEMIYKVFESNTKMDRDIASALYAGIITDSGGLRFKSTSPETLRIVSKLMEKEIDFPFIYREVMFRRSLAEVNALKRTINNMILDFENHIAYSFFTLKEMQEENITPDNFDGLVQFLLNIDNIFVSVFVYENEPEVFKVSLRSIYLDVNNIASKFDGGGHINAAGCIINGEKEIVYEKIKNEIMKGLTK